MCLMKDHNNVWFILVHYEGILAEDEKVFDTTREDNLVFSFELGTGSVIRSWDIALKTMKVSIIWLFLLFFQSEHFQFIIYNWLANLFFRLEKLQKSQVSQNMLTEEQGLLLTSHLSMLCYTPLVSHSRRVTVTVFFVIDMFGNCSATLIFEVELVACRPRKGASVGSVSEERARLE